MKGGKHILPILTWTEEDVGAIFENTDYHIQSIMTLHII